MSAPIVQILFKGRMLRSLSFEGEQLRIGRMRENDIVIDNLSVSRFHATLTKQNGRIVLEDLGSENGCSVNGLRVERAEVEPGDEILIGKHQLMLRSPLEPGVHAARVMAERVASGAWDGAKTYMMGPDTRDGAMGPAVGAAGPEAAEDPLAGMTDDDEAEDGISAEESEPPVVLAKPDPPELSAEPETPALYAGLVMQKEGKLDRVLRWEKDRLVAGRSNDCDILLRHAEVSRQHTVFVREGDDFEVRDLDSINGTFVNGESVKRRRLEVGDVVRIEDYEFTFVLERQPIGNEIKTHTLPPHPASLPDSNEFTIIEERAPALVEAPVSPLDELTDPAPPGPEPQPAPDLRPLPNPVRTRDAFPASPPAPEAEPALALAPEPEPSPAAAFELARAPLAVQAATTEPEPASAAGPEAVCLELRVRLEDLPAPLRDLFNRAEGEPELRIAAELRLRPAED